MKTGAWVVDLAENANLLAETFETKCRLLEVKHNHYSDLPSTPYRPQGLVKGFSEHAR